MPFQSDEAIITSVVRARHVRIDGLTVTAARPLFGTTILLPPQVCDLAQLTPGETIEIRNLTTGRHFVAPLRVGGVGEVAVYGYADPDLALGDTLRITAGER